jgi:hypothetical protein
MPSSKPSSNIQHFVRKNAAAPMIALAIAKVSQTISKAECWKYDCLLKNELFFDFFYSRSTFDFLNMNALFVKGNKKR